MLVVKIKKLNHNAIIPSYAEFGDAGMDLTAISSTIDENGNRMYGTGLAMEIPEGYVGLIFPRSSISKYSLDLANAVGVIDSKYRGEIICKFKPTPHFNQSADPNTFITKNTIIFENYHIGDRIAQIIILPYPLIQFSIVDELSSTERGDKGFGSTGS